MIKSMRIFVDIGHPAHVHYFRNFILTMQSKGHYVFVSARNRSIIHYLLHYYNIPFFNRGKGKNSIIGKLIYMFIADFRILGKAIRCKPDIFISFASPYAAQVAWLMRKPHIALDDTEHAKSSQRLYKPFSAVFLNPATFYKDFGPKQIRFNSFVELFYLHHNWYTPSDDVLNILGIKKSEKIILLRFVSWKANHDFGHSGLNLETKKRLVLDLSKKYKVFISTEEERPDPFFDRYLLNIPPEKVHDLLREALLFIAESGTMASEAAILGTPVIYVNSLPLMGYLKEEMAAGMLFHYKNSQNVLEKANELLANSDLKKEFQSRHQKLISDKIDITAFLVWFIENFPESMKIMRDTPNYQDNFI